MVPDLRMLVFPTLLAVAVVACVPAPTYHADVAGILAKNCASCHRAGAIAPFALTTYEDARRAGASMAAATRARRMPPWNIDNSGACQTYTNARWLTEGEIDTIGRWVKTGMLEGVRREPLPLPTEIELRDPVVRGMPVAYQPHSSAGHPSDDYRCFLVDGFDRDTHVTGFEVRPGRLAQVHHILGYVLTTDAGERTLRNKDAADPVAGWDCFGGPGTDDAQGILGWAPGKMRDRYPSGIGIEVPGKRPLVLEVHYNLKNGNEPDQTSVAFELTDSVERAGLILTLDDGALNLPPGAREARHTHEFTFASLGVTETVVAYGAGPHMHLLGRQQRLERLRPRGSTQCLMDVRDWDFHWQDTGFFAVPQKIEPTDVLRTTCVYDTTSRSEPVRWGEGTAEEMCLSSVVITRENGRSFSER